MRLSLVLPTLAGFSLLRTTRAQTANGTAAPTEPPLEDGSNGTSPVTSAPSDIEVGTSYCTYAPDYACYIFGWPACCDINDGDACPEEQPPCELGANNGTSSETNETETIAPSGTEVPGSSYCTYAPDPSCYKEGWPYCCVTMGVLCPREQPPCDVETSVPTASTETATSAPTQAPSAVGISSTNTSSAYGTAGGATSITFLLLLAGSVFAM